MTPDAINQKWYQLALHDFCTLNGKQTEEVFLSASVDFLWPLFALLDDLALTLTGDAQARVLTRRDEILREVEEKMLAAVTRLRSVSPSHTRLQAMLEKVRASRPEAQ